MLITVFSLELRSHAFIGWQECEDLQRYSWWCVLMTLLLFRLIFDLRRALELPVVPSLLLIILLECLKKTLFGRTSPSICDEGCFAFGNQALITTFATFGHLDE